MDGVLDAKGPILFMSYSHPDVFDFAITCWHFYQFLPNINYESNNLLIAKSGSRDQEEMVLNEHNKWFLV